MLPNFKKETQQFAPKAFSIKETTRLNQAISLHQQGHLEEAAVLYQKHAQLVHGSLISYYSLL